MANEFGTLTPGVFPSILESTFADDSTQPFWDAAANDQLVAPKCTSCGTFRLPPAPFCWVCQHRDVEWVQLPGTGTIYSFIVVRHPLHPDMAACCPYVSGAVELDGTQGAGARMLVNIIDCDPETVRIGDRVEIVFEHLNDEMHTPRFRPMQRQP
jgi:uncharacterized protein